MSRTIIAGDYLVRDALLPPEMGWAVVANGSIIEAVGHRRDLLARFPDAILVECDGKAVAPGLVNAHHHMYGVLAHGIPLDKAPAGFWPFLRDFWWPRVEDALDQSMIAAATELACLEMVRSGVTSFYDCLEAPNALLGPLEVEAAIVRRWGLRGILSFEATERAGAETAELGLRENAEFIDSSGSDGGQVRGMMCFHTSFSCSPEYVQRAVGLARERGAKCHMHLSEGGFEPEYCRSRFGRLPVEHYDSLGALGPWTLASQCVHVNPREIGLLAERGCAVSHMPMSNCEVGGGIAPVPEILSAGLTVGLGTDGYVSSVFENMRWASLVHKARLQDPTAMPSAAVWHMATAGGALALGIDGVGRLEPGAAADLIVIDLDLPTPVTRDNLLDQLLLWRGPEHVTDVMTAGRWLKRDGVVANADEQAIRAHCREAAGRLWRQS